MRDRDTPIRRGWFLLQDDGTFDFDDPQYGPVPDGSWIARFREDGQLITLYGFPPDTPPAGSKHGDAYPRGVLTHRRD